MLSLLRVRDFEDRRHGDNERNDDERNFERPWRGEVEGAESSSSSEVAGKLVLDVLRRIERKFIKREWGEQPVTVPKY